MTNSYQPIDSDSAGRPRRLVNGVRRETRCDLCGEWTAGIGAHRESERCRSAKAARELTEAGYVRVPSVAGATAAARRMAGEPCSYLTGFRPGGPGRYSMRTTQRWTILPAGWEMGPRGPRPLPVYEAPPAMAGSSGMMGHWGAESIGQYTPGHPLSPRLSTYSYCGSYGYRVGWGHLAGAASAARRAALVGGCYLL